MAWYVNGVKVYDTLGGNEGGSLADHAFTLPLKKGRNIVVVQVLSGSQGWSFDFGGPKERSRALSANNDPDSLAATLSVAGAVVARQTASLHIQEPVPPLGNTPADQLSAWQPLEPLVVLEGDAVKNLFMKEPDSSRWYTGARDLSGTIWLRDDGTNLHLFAAVTDDKLVQPATPAQLPQGDSLRVVLADDAGNKMLDAIGGLIAGKPVLVGASSSVKLTAWRQKTRHRPRDLLSPVDPEIAPGPPAVSPEPLRRRQRRREPVTRTLHRRPTRQGMRLTTETP